MMRYWNDKKVMTPIVALLAVAVCGCLYMSFLWNQKRVLKKRNAHQISLLRAYLRESRHVPTQEEVVALSKHKSYLDSQFEQLQARLKHKEGFSKRYPEVERPLEFRELVSDLKMKLNRQQIGFEAYAQKIPHDKDLADLKKHLALVEDLVIVGQKNRIKEITDIVRFPLKKIRAHKQDMFTLYPVVISMKTRSEELFRFLYDVASLEGLVLIEGVQVKSKVNYDLEVDVKLSYVEMLKS